MIVVIKSEVWEFRACSDFATKNIHAGQYDLAIRQLNQTIELDPNNYRTFMFLGRTLAWVDRNDEAMVAFQKALSINPDNLEALALMGVLKAGAGDRQGALKIMKRVVAAGTKTEPAILVAHILARLGEASQMFEFVPAQKIPPLERLMKTLGGRYGDSKYPHS